MVGVSLRAKRQRCLCQPPPTVGLSEWRPFACEVGVILLCPIQAWGWQEEPWRGARHSLSHGAAIVECRLSNSVKQPLYPSHRQPGGPEHSPGTKGLNRGRLSGWGDP